jgi:hypothetical protein
VELLESHRDAVESIVRALMKYETIEGKEVDTLMAGGEIVRDNGNGEGPDETTRPEPDDDAHEPAAGAAEPAPSEDTPQTTPAGDDAAQPDGDDETRESA